ncbi:MAG: putative outer membrane repeat protein [Arcticibacterium sp.]|jgi:predicted outer membrane repeat protein
MLLLLLPQVANATIRYVKSTASGIGDGTDWANASDNLQAMIDSSSSNDEVWVMTGTYKPANYPTGCTDCGEERDFSFMVKNQVKVYGSFIGTETLLSERTNAVILANPSVLSGDIGVQNDSTDNVYHVIMSVSDDSTTVLDGFTIYKGFSVGASGNRSMEAKLISKALGAGMHNRSSFVRIRNCDFKDNAGNSGGGMYNNYSDVSIEKCNYLNNYADFVGGGIYNSLGSIIINYCQFTDNHADATGGGGIYNQGTLSYVYNSNFDNNSAYFYGGGVNDSYAYDLESKYENCLFRNNSATLNGGGMHLRGSGSILISNSQFETNTSESGGGVFTVDASPKFQHCLFDENIAMEDGGALEVFDTYNGDGPNFENCVFINNSAKKGGAVHNNYDTESTFVNCTFTSNEATVNGGAMYNTSNFFIPNGGGGLPVRAYIKNCIFWNNTINGSTTNPGADLEGHHDNFYQFYVSYSTLQLADNNTNYWEATSQGFIRSGSTSDGGIGNLHATDPIFTNTADLDGTDNIFGTADDGLTLQNNSPAINQGLNNYVTYTSDFASTLRIQNIVVDIGAYESSFIPNTPAFARRFVKTVAVGLGDGSNWENASSNLQAMIDSSEVGNEVWVAVGTYFPSNYPSGCVNCTTTREYAFMLKNEVKVYGSFAGSETMLSERTESVRNANPSILSADFGIINSYTDNAFHVVISVRDLSTTVLDGFTITRGYNYSGNELKIENHTIRNTGGGMINVSSSPTIRHCIFTLNRASTDGGMTNTRYSSPIVDSCTISNNISSSTGGMGNSYGSSPTISYCTFLNNSCTYYGGAMRNFSSSSPMISYSTFNNNSTYYSGGAIYNNSKSTATIDHCVFTINSVQNGSGGAISHDGGLLKVSNSIFAGNRSNDWKGGAIANWDSTLIINSTFRDNGADTDGGGIYTDGSIEIFNSTFYANYASVGGGISNASGKSTIVNTIFWDNRIGASYTAVGADVRTDQSSAETYATYSSLQQANNATNYPNNGSDKGFLGTGEGNVFETNPLFLKPLDTNGDDDLYFTLDDGYTLQNCSPLKNIGSNSGIPAGTSMDITGNPRIFNTTVDMGAYENQSGQMTVAIDSDPVNATICPGYTISFTAIPTNVGPNPNYNFLVNGISTQYNSNPIFTSLALANSDIIKTILTSGSCIDTSNAITVTHYSLPIPSTGSNSPVCEGAILNLNSSGGSSYTWVGPNSFSSESQNPNLASTPFIASGTYIVTVTDANSCTATSSVLVEVNQVAPNISATPSVVNFGENTTLTATGCSGLIQWSLAGLTTNPLVIKFDNSSNFTATCTVGNCKSLPSGLTSVTVNGNPCQNQITLISTTNDYSSGTYRKVASSTTGKITATNKLTGSTKVIYHGKSIELSPGFKAENGTLFLAETGGCQ